MPIDWTKVEKGIEEAREQLKDQPPITVTKVTAADILAQPTLPDSLVVAPTAPKPVTASAFSAQQIGTTSASSIPLAQRQQLQQSEIQRQLAKAEIRQRDIETLRRTSKEVEIDVTTPQSLGERILAGEVVPVDREIWNKLSPRLKAVSRPVDPLRPPTVVATCPSSSFQGVIFCHNPSLGVTCSFADLPSLA